MTNINLTRQLPQPSSISDPQLKAYLAELVRELEIRLRSIKEALNA